MMIAAAVQPVVIPLAPGVPVAAPGPLAAEHLAAIAEARVRGKKVRRAANVAAMSGWTMVVFALVTLLGGLFGDFVALVLGTLLGVIAFNELRGAAMLRRFEMRGPRVLGWNQIGLGALLVVYGVYSLVHALTHPLLASVGQSTGDAEMDAMIGRISDLAAYGLYGGVAIFGIIGPGLTAWYYFSRAKVVRTMVEGTPEWVIGAMRAVG